MKTVAEWAALALDVQDACNLSGVVRSFAQATETLWAQARELNKGTEFVNTHPVSVLFASKIAQLTGCERTSEFSRAYGECIKLAGR